MIQINPAKTFWTAVQRFFALGQQRPRELGVSPAVSVVLDLIKANSIGGGRTIQENATGAGTFATHTVPKGHIWVLHRWHVQKNGGVFTLEQVVADVTARPMQISGNQRMIIGFPNITTNTIAVGPGDQLILMPLDLIRVVVSGFTSAGTLDLGLMVTDIPFTEETGIQVS